MATPADHYREAQRLTEAARADFRDAGEGRARVLAESRAHVALAAAQAHATLALAGATFLASRDGLYPSAANDFVDALTERASVREVMDRVHRAASDGS